MQIKLTDVDALEALNAKLDKLTKLQEVMKEINSIIRNKKLTDADKSKVIMEQYNLSTETIEKLLHPQMSWNNPGFQRWELSNNNQEI